MKRDSPHQFNLMIDLENITHRNPKITTNAMLSELADEMYADTILDIVAYTYSGPTVWSHERSEKNINV